MFIQILVNWTLLLLCTGPAVNQRISAARLQQNIIFPTNKCNEINELNKLLNPNTKITRNRRIPQKFGNLQYAPLELKSKEERKKPFILQRSTEAAILEGNPDKNNDGILQIEPHTDSNDEQNESSQKEIYGHNIAIINKDTIQSKSGQLSNMLEKYENIKINKNNKYSNENSLIPIILNPLDMQEPTRTFYNEKAIFHENTFYKPIKKEPRDYKGLQAINDGELQVAISAFVKMPRKHLNVARSYSTNVQSKQTFRHNKKHTELLKTPSHPLYYSHSCIHRIKSNI